MPDSYADLRAKAERFVAAQAGPDAYAEAAAEFSYRAAASPSVVLGLLDENDRLRALLRRVSSAWEGISPRVDVLPPRRRDEAVAGVTAEIEHRAAHAAIKDALAAKEGA